VGGVLLEKLAEALAPACRLVVLEACDLAGGFAHELLQAVPDVVAMQTAVDLAWSRSFSSDFAGPRGWARRRS